MSELGPYASSAELTTAEVLGSVVHEFVADYGFLARQNNAQTNFGNSEAATESFVGFTERQYAYTFDFHIDGANQAELDCLISEEGYAEIGLRLLRDGEPVELGAQPGDEVIDNLYSVVLLDGQAPFIALLDDLDSYLSSEDKMIYHKSKKEGTEHFLEMAQRGEASLRILDSNECAQLLTALTSPELPDYISSD